MKNFFKLNKLNTFGSHTRCHILIILVSCILFILPWINAFAGNYSETSPFSCGANCSGGYERFGHSASYCLSHPGECYNTIDSCTDGNNPQYEYVENITITDLNSTNFTGGDTVNIDAYVDCDSDGDWVVFAYHNGTGFRSLNEQFCDVDDKDHKYYDFTLDNLGGNQTVRVAIAYAGASGFICGGEASYPQWSDTDDVTFLVQSIPDNENPSVTDPVPAPDATYESQENLEILICVNAIDNQELDKVIANISWDAGNSLMQLESSELLYCNNFTNTTEIGTYNVSFIVNDTSGNVNDSVTTYFVIQHTSNIVPYSPVQGDVFTYGPMPLNFTIDAIGYDLDAVFYSLDNGQTNTTITSRGINVSFTQPDADETTGENTTDYANLSMSFKPVEEMNVKLVSISLKKEGSGTPDAQLQLRTDDAGQPSDTILAYGNITDSDVSTDNYSFVDITLNTTVSLEADTTYWLFLTPNSSAPDYYSWESSNDGFYADGNYSNNDSLDLLFIIYDAYNYRTTIEGIPPGAYTIIIYANSTSNETLAAPQVDFSIDYTAPSLNDFTYSPNTAEGLDPNVTINLTANVTDDLALQEVFIQYKGEEESDFQNATTTQDGDLYTANMTPDAEGTWAVRVMAWDTSNNTLISDELYFDIAWDYEWNALPESFDTTSAFLNTNVSVGNITINNTADFMFSFNISKAETILPIYFNNTPDSIIINVSPGTASQVEVSATGQSIESEQPISILIDALDDGAQPDFVSNDFTFISYVAGPYLKIEITEYDSTVTQGQERVGLTARIINLGNETANNVYAYWDLPSDWSAKTNLSAEYDSLGVGEEVEFTRFVNIEGSAATGTQNISVYVNCSEEKNDSDQRSVNVNSSGEEEETPIVHRGGGGGGGSVVPEKTTKLNIIIPKEVEVERGTNITIAGVLENNGETDLKKISLALENFPIVHYKINPAAIDELKASDKKSFSLFLDVPPYLGSGKQKAALAVKALVNDAWKEFSQGITLIVISEDKADATGCFGNADSKLAELEKQGIGTAGLSRKLEEAKKKYDNKDYPEASSLCNEIMQEAELALKLNEQMAAINSDYSGLRKEVPEISELIKLAREAFEREDYTLAGLRAEQAQLLVGMKEKEVQQTLSYRANFIREHLSQIIPALAIMMIISIFIHSSTSLSAVKKKMKALETRKENIKMNIKEVQEKYFIQKILSRRVYDREMAHYRSMLAEIEKRKSELEVKKLKVISGHTVQDLEKVKAETEESKKALQRRYFVEKSIDKKTFKKLSLSLDRTLQEFDRRIALKKERK